MCGCWIQPYPDHDSFLVPRTLPFKPRHGCAHPVRYHSIPKHIDSLIHFDTHGSLSIATRRQIHLHFHISGEGGRTEKKRRTSPPPRPLLRAVHGDPPLPPSSPHPTATATGTTDGTFTSTSTSTSTSTFAFVRNRRRIDWRLLSRINISSIREKNNTAALNDVIDLLTYGDLDAEDVSPHHQRVAFRLAQMCMECLLFVQSDLLTQASLVATDRARLLKHEAALKVRRSSYHTI